MLLQSVNIFKLRLATYKNAKKLCLFDYNLPLSFRNKTIKMTRKTVAGFTRYGTKTAVFFKKHAFLLHVLNKNKNQILSMICSGLSENRKKLIPSGKKTQSVLIANSCSRKIQKNFQSAKITFRKNFVLPADALSRKILTQ